MIEELRVIATDFELRDDSPRTLVGYAARFMVLSQDLGGFKERIFPGAFRKSLSSGQEVVALNQHLWWQPAGRRSENTLKLFEDTHGLRSEITLPNTTYGNDMIELVRGRYVKGMSFGFNIVDSNVVRDGDEFIQELREIDLHEVSIVTNPAYVQTTVSLRSIERVNEARALAGVPLLDVCLTRETRSTDLVHRIMLCA